MKDTAQVEIHGLAAGGAGVARLPDGCVVFVPRTAPGDRATVEVTRRRRRWARGRLLRLEAPSPERVEPRCPHYAACGGCSLQHLPYEAQLAWKGRMIADALRRIGGLDVAVPTVRPSPRTEGYRNRVTYTLRRLRGGRVVAGFHALDRPPHVLDVGDACLLPEPPLAEAWREVRRAWGKGARNLPEGGRLSLTLRAHHVGVDLVVGGGAPGWDPRPLAEGLEGVTALWHQPARDRPAMRVWGEPGFDDWGDERFPVEGRAFLQVNRGAASLLAETVTTAVLEGVGAPRALDGAGSPGGAAPPSSGATSSVAERTAAPAVVDAYCGAGLYGRALARAGLRVVGIERDPAAVAAASADAPPGFSVLEGGVEEHLPGVLPADWVILNPPRTGLAREVVDVLVARPPRALLYVSCDPATLARDAAGLRAAFDLEGIDAFDLFPQTAHVETVARFVRSREDAP